MSQGQLFTDDDAALEDDYRTPLPARDDWRFRPAEAFHTWVTEIATCGAEDTSYSPVSTHQFEAMFGQFWRHMLDSKPKRNVLTVGPPEINAFLNSLEGRDPGPPGQKNESGKPVSNVSRTVLVSTKRRYLKLLNDLMEHLVGCGYRKTNPIRQTARMINGGRRARESGVVFLREADASRLIEYLREEADITEWEARRDRALVLFILGTGVTASQAVTAVVEDFIFNDVEPAFDVREWSEEEGIRKRRYTVELSPFCIDVVREWLAERREYLNSPSCKEGTTARIAFPGFRWAGREMTTTGLYLNVRKALRAIGCVEDDMGPRVLRHTFIRRLILQGIPDDDIKRMCGLQTTKTIDRIRMLTPKPGLFRVEQEPPGPATTPIVERAPSSEIPLDTPSHSVATG